MKHVPDPDGWSPNQVIWVAAFLEQIINDIWRSMTTVLTDAANAEAGEQPPDGPLQP